MGVIAFDLQGYLAISTQNSSERCSMSLLYTDLGLPRGVTRPSVLLILLANEETFEQIVKLVVIWDAMMLM